MQQSPFNPAVVQATVHKSPTEPQGKRQTGITPVVQQSPPARQGTTKAVFLKP